MINVSVVRGAAALAGALLALGLVGSAAAQAPKAGLAECNQLYGQWSRYNGTSAYGKMLTADMAIEECRKGNTEAGIADLKRALERSGIPVPPSETAAAPR
jgi:hypothetical protein